MKNVDKTKTVFFSIFLILFLVVDVYASWYFLGRQDFPSIVPTTEQSSNTFSSLNKSQDIKVTDKVYISQETAKIWQGVLDNIPANPSVVHATAKTNGKVITLSSNENYSYQEIFFSWEGDYPRESGTKIVGYYVYFGEKDTDIPFPESGYYKSVNPKNDGIFVETNNYTAKNLIKGNTYHLYVQAVSDSKNPNPYYQFGMDIVGQYETLAAKKLFTYHYQ